MNLQVNGNRMELPDEASTVERLLEHLKVAGKILVVEHNGRIVDRGNYTETALADGDTVEIVHFVGGG